MIIYNFFDESGFYSMIFFIVVSTILLCLTVWILYKIRKIGLRDTFGKNVVGSILRTLALLIPIIAFIFTSWHSVSLGREYYLYSRNDYIKITGTLSQVSEVRNDYRNNELYDISFCVNDDKFENSNISCSKELLDKLIETEGEEITVYYSKIKGREFVYFIEIYI